MQLGYAVHVQQDQWIQALPAYCQHLSQHVRMNMNNSCFLDIVTCKHSKITPGSRMSPSSVLLPSGRRKTCWALFCAEEIQPSFGTFTLHGKQEGALLHSWVLSQKMQNMSTVNTELYKENWIMLENDTRPHYWVTYCSPNQKLFCSVQEKNKQKWNNIKIIFSCHLLQAYHLNCLLQSPYQTQPLR